MHSERTGSDQRRGIDQGGPLPASRALRRAGRQFSSPKRRTIVVTGSLAFAGLFVAACGAPSTPSVARLPGSTGATTTTAVPAVGDQAMVDYAHCLRSHGVAEPDPTHRPGYTGLSVVIPTRSPANAHALDACTPYISALIKMKEAGVPIPSGPRLAALIRYAQCMRAHDIDMLDPNHFGSLNLGNVPGITSNFGRYSSQFRAADASCRHLLPTGVRDNGSGPP